jgi:hypothetical protein
MARMGTLLSMLDERAIPDPPVSSLQGLVDLLFLEVGDAATRKRPSRFGTPSPKDGRRHLPSVLNVTMLANGPKSK